ncbi:hypothetical protein N7448_011287 [Penicillium atrosanguineum]|nr:hypothetical protein N7448_011287 [Penicillium atrosanguineum]
MKMVVDMLSVHFPDDILKGEETITEEPVVGELIGRKRVTKEPAEDLAEDPAEITAEDPAEDSTEDWIISEESSGKLP